ncbi:MAG: type I methionyl aminopeptidase [Thermoflexus sp.]|jgi:methionyl aminopeptidase|uniref:type I methionyl aminopeptidase n=1 Tax=Thermoflexus sp. TaxID=1969742 RepID=UPI0026104472|nr:type I methionyl aminopeptidase [Thermoflexus sp.]MDT7883547.1 type I methionyl aminopeptidase [Thermoflexus sp.]MDT7947089.1 type I methionyl aminopeptidase [Thermoflexus sp.]
MSPWVVPRTRRPAEGIRLKTWQEIRMMREAGRIVAEVLEAMRTLVQPGVTTAELDRWAEDYIRRRGGIPAFKGYPSMKDEGGPPYPATLCTSVNHVLVHGIPGPYRLREGDIISIDVGVNFRGYFADGAITLPVGEISPEARRLIEVTQAALWAAIAQARAGRRLGDIQWAIQHTVESQGFQVAREFVSHGVGRALHEAPSFVNRGRPGRGLPLRPGMTLAIEPMVIMGDWRTRILEDGWTVVTLDGSLTAHFEHTVAITEGDPIILTALEDDPRLAS